MSLKKICPFLLTVLMIFSLACDNEEDKPPVDNSAYSASGAVSSNEDGQIETESGASITIPIYAVPATAGGDNGTMVFSIERDQSVSAPVPDGETIASDVYRFGPDGFVFAAPVKITIPVNSSIESEAYRLYRIDQTTNEAISYPAIYDEETKTVSTMTYELSPWFPTSFSWDDYYDGALQFTNNSSSKWLYITSVSCSLKYPTVNNCPICGYHHALFAPSGTIGWVNSGNWYIAQGVHTLCVEMHEQGTYSSPPGPKSHIYIENVVVDGAWSYWNDHVSSSFSFSSLTDAIDGPCDCTPDPTPSPGTGDVQVTLTWYNASSIDLDLWIYEPNGDTCYYGNNPTSTGGTLDRDNKCYDYINGRPENIFWSNAPVGQYRVLVDWFGNCGNPITSQSYDVRVVNGSTVRTYSGTITENSLVSICTFTVSSATKGRTVEYLGTSEPRTSARPPKE
ncbi:hypothetical protein JW877_09575 [bacterium]|nr:hypothetical protein [bacterium]